jgi:archaellin
MAGNDEALTRLEAALMIIAIVVVAALFTYHVMNA